MVKIGDRVVRMLCGTVPMELTVTDITHDLIVCGPWKFSRENGVEIDEDLGWTKEVSGSFIYFRAPDCVWVCSRCGGEPVFSKTLSNDFYNMANARCITPGCGGGVYKPKRKGADV